MTAKNPAAVALGKLSSPHKAATARHNGRKGGRPRKVSTVELEFLVTQWRAEATGGVGNPYGGIDRVAEARQDCAADLERVIRNAHEGR